MPEKYRLLVLLAAWCGLRFGELTELRRSDLDMRNGRIKIRRAVVHLNGEIIVGTPKSDAGVRDVAIPPHLLPIVKSHIAEHAEFGRDGLLFPASGGGHLSPSSLYGRAPTRTRSGWGFYAARATAKRPDLRFHDLRHTGAVLAAATGATMAELMARLGHSTQGAALRYQHAAQDRDMEIAKRLSAMVTQ
jgi:integrase